MFVTGLHNEKKLDTKTAGIIGLDFGLEDIISTIFKVEQGPNFHIMREKVNILSSF